MKNQCRGGHCLKRGGGGGLGLFANLRVGLARKKVVVFLRGGVDIPIHTMFSKFINSLNPLNTSVAPI